jgi:hypothetical protein
MYLLPSVSYINNLPSSLADDDTCSSKTSPNISVTTGIKLNKSDEWSAVLLPVWDVLGKNIGPETVYPKLFCGLPQSQQADAGIIF